MDRFAITDVRVFDGTGVVDASVVVVADGAIAEIGHRAPDGVEQVDGSGGTVLPGLIEAHAHSDAESLRTALSFGVTTELDLMSVPEVMTPLRERVRTDFGLADVRSSSWAVAHPQGHPHQLRRGQGDPDWPTVTTPDEAQGFVDARRAEGADYIKIIVEDGTAIGGALPAVTPDVLEATVDAAHARGLPALVHTLNASATRQAVAAGADGLTHLQFDEVIDADVIARMVDQGMFVISTLSVAASAAADGSGARLAADLRVASRLDEAWLDNLEHPFSWNAHLPHALRSVALLHDAGVDVLAGSDASHLGGTGLAHGASLLDELRLLGRAGLRPAEALTAATRRTADRFGLTDRGRIEPGAAADLLLVDGDPTESLSAVFNTRAVWRRGHRFVPRETKVVAHA